MTQTRVIHIREARDAPDEVYIGRAGKGHDGYFGNPFQIGRDGSRAEVIEKCRKYLVERIASDPKFRERVRDLHGKTLTCFCKPAPCHGDLLAEAADRLASETVPPLARKASSKRPTKEE